VARKDPCHGWWGATERIHTDGGAPRKFDCNRGMSFTDEWAIQKFALYGRTARPKPNFVCSPNCSGAGHFEASACREKRLRPARLHTYIVMECVLFVLQTHTHFATSGIRHFWMYCPERLVGSVNECSGAVLQLRGGGRPCKNQTQGWPGAGKIAGAEASKREGIRLALKILNLTLRDMARGQETGLCGVEIPERECMICGTMNVRMGVTWQGITQVCLSMCLSFYLSISVYLAIRLSVVIYLSVCLSVCLSVFCPSICLFVYLSVCRSVCACLSICLSVCLSVYLYVLSVCLPFRLSVCLSIFLSICLSICLSVYLSVCLSVCRCVYLSVYLSTCLSTCLSVYLSVYLSICLSICLSVCLPVYLSICQSICLFVCLSVYLSVCLSVYLSICLSVCLSVYLPVCLSVCLSVCLFLYLSVCLPISCIGSIEFSSM